MPGSPVAGLSDLSALLRGLSPALAPGTYVFVTVGPAAYGAYAGLNPLASFREAEGLSLVCRREAADGHGLAYDGLFRLITLRVHSSLGAVGLTAAVARRLTREGIPANVIAAFHHDHILVPAHRGSDAVAALRALAAERTGPSAGDLE
ncbi:hypothetical protein KBTX_02416 [wastewater metagenome]|uniref:Aspartate kinase n=2 Tax=unclassified sequences TaxID=12908 RepID=A0A5B8RH57_9ZZZZ|nr:ACT domain-containing protein [Arhodomonas aquaeolei]QEA06087.1 hypothetical protein KBTEX_02416 [uncultured organism]